MATEKRVTSSVRRAAQPRRPSEAEAVMPSDEDLRQLQILNQRILQVMEALRRLNEGSPYRS
jgi:hypothetical protein